VKGIDDLDVLDVRDSIHGVAEMFHVVLKAFLMLLIDGLQGFSCRWMLVCTMKVPDEHCTKLVPVVDGSFGQIDKPRSSHMGQCRGQIVGLYPIVTSGGLNDSIIDLDKFFWIAGAIIPVNMPELELL
jgi:hypothetical protein